MQYLLIFHVLTILEVRKEHSCLNILHEKDSCICRQ